VAYEIEIAESAANELEAFKAFIRRRLVREIQDQLSHQPAKETQNKKRLPAILEAGFEFVPPLWELRVGEVRVFFDVDADAEKVFVRAIRRKPPELRTGEVIK
jgi:mRNA-degrading endonuclease RelE of RelBE toxin-antitoxin system